ncbi:MAG: hypothetical protein MZU95_14330 [Desulfomicrobium escambiense]|nr:hypothetical protein [Desulfomicrobium escambiense]
MKRITQDIKRLDLIATLFDIAYVLIVGFLLARFFTILRTPGQHHPIDQLRLLTSSGCSPGTRAN